MQEITAPRTVVTVQNGKGTRRYLVDRADEHVLDHLPDGPVDPETVRGMSGAAGFGCQWLRSRNIVDEMYRTLSLWDVVRISRKTITVRWAY